MDYSAVSNRTITVTIKLESDREILELHKVLDHAYDHDLLPGSLYELRNQLSNFAHGIF